MRYIILIFFSMLFCIKVDYVNAYYDIENKYDLYNPQMNNESTIISAEVYTKKIDLVKSKKANKDELIFFNNNGNSFESFQLFKTFKPEYKIKVPYHSGFLSWSKYDPKIIYSILTGDQSQFTLSMLDTLLNKKKINQVELNEDYKFKMMNDGWGDFEFDAKYIYMHKVLFDIEEDNDFNYVLFREIYDDVKIATNHPQYLENTTIINEKDLNQGDGSCFKASECPISSSKTNLVKFDVSKNGDDLDFVFQIRNDEYQNSIILYRGCFDSEYMPIISNNGDISKSQINPVFNSSGNRISFLSRQNTPGSILYDLYVVNLIGEDDEDCYDFLEKVNENSSFNFNYQLIDSNIMDEDFYGSGERSNFTSHCWHPDKDILFYIKTENADSNTGGANHPIYYFDFDKNKGGKLNIPTKNNKYISISDDGQYLLFSFIGIEDEANKNNFQFNNSKGLDKADVLTDFGNNKIGVAKLIYD